MVARRSMVVAGAGLVFVASVLSIGKSEHTKPERGFDRSGVAQSTATLEASRAKPRPVTREVAGGRDIRIAGGAHTIRAYLQAGLVDEFHVALAPVFLGEGTRLFDRMDDATLSLEIIRSVHSPMVTHVFYAVRKKA